MSLSTDFDETVFVRGLRYRIAVGAAWAEAWDGERPVWTEALPEDEARDRRDELIGKLVRKAAEDARSRGGLRPVPAPGPAAPAPPRPRPPDAR